MYFGPLGGAAQHQRVQAQIHVVKVGTFQGYIPPNMQPAITANSPRGGRIAGPRRLPTGYAPTERQISHVHLQEGYHTVPMGCGGAALALCSTLRPPGLCYSTQLGPC